MNLKITKFQNIILVLVIMLFSISLFSQDLENKVKVHKLKNGLTVLFVERHEAPVFSALYGFKVGSVDEQPGITGVAHLFEHMAFKGTPKIGTSDFAKEKEIMDKINAIGKEMSLELMKGDMADKDKIKKLKDDFAVLDKEQKKYIVKDEIWTIYNNEGGVGLNASTSNDVTQYIVSLPSNRFELYCLMESERMKNGVLREFYTERSVIQEERKQTLEASPREVIDELFTAAAFIAHPYNHSVVGWASDIYTVTLEEAQDFKNKYYTPNNCVMALVGDIYPEKAIPIIEKYFEDFKRGPEPPQVRTVEPKQIGERRVKAELASEPMFMMGFHKPTIPNRDAVVMSVITRLLSTGRTCRLYKDLIETKQLATNIRCSSGPGERYDNLLIFTASPRFPHTNAELETAILEHLDKLKTELVPEEELQKVKKGLEVSIFQTMKQNMGLAMTLTRYQVLYGDWKLFLKIREMQQSITPQEIMECAKKYFTTENKTVAFLEKKGK